MFRKEGGTMERNKKQKIETREENFDVQVRPAVT